MTGNWGGLRDDLQDAGITIAGTYTWDPSWLAAGGARRRVVERGLLSLILEADLARLVGLTGGTMKITYDTRHGDDPTNDVGVAQVISTIDAGNIHQIAELWYEQWLVEKGMRLMVGKMDANDDFACVEGTKAFLNDSPAPAQTNFLMPSYPNPATGLNVFVYPTEQLWAGFGVYDGAGLVGVQTGSRGPETFLDDSKNLYVIGEVGAKWAMSNEDLPGRAGLGGWHHNGVATRFDETTQKGVSGLYLVADQALWRPSSTAVDDPREMAEDDQRGVGAFFQYGYADKNVSPIEQYAGGGLTWRGPFRKRAEDVVGVSLHWVQFSQENRDGFTSRHETTLELLYQVRVTHWVVLQPDIQYIINPARVPGLENALAFTVRAAVNF